VHGLITEMKVTVCQCHWNGLLTSQPTGIVILMLQWNRVIF
jgi:hypothetical protein